MTLTFPAAFNKQLSFNKNNLQGIYMDKQPSSQAHRKSEVTIIAGFLGAGKTTLLKKILSWESDLSETVVIVNEFGDVGIDGSLLKNAGSDMVELTGGCICCTMK